MANTKKKPVAKKVVKKVTKKEIIKPKESVTKEIIKPKEETKKYVIEKNDRVIKLSNYIVVFVGLLLTILLVFFIRSTVENYKKNVSFVSVFSENVNQIKLTDLEYAVAEMGESIIYVSYTGDRNIKKMESKLYSTIEDEGIKEKVVYLDVSDYKKNYEYLTVLRKLFPNIKNEINAAPMFIYVKSGIAEEALSSELKMIDSKVFNKLIEKYNIE